MKALIIVNLLAIFFIACSDIKSKEKMEKQNGDLILIDTIPWKNGKSIYWYKLRDLLGTTSVSFIGIYDNACNIDTVNFLVKGDLLYEIKLLNPNQLQITSHFGFDIIHKTKEIEFLDKHFEYGQKFIRNSIQKDILLDSICSSFRKRKQMAVPNRITKGISDEGYNEQGITYDKMGNIKTLTRPKISATAITYNYGTKGNQLQSVSGGYARGYTYNGNGSIATMTGTNPLTIVYNELNLPKTVTGSATVSYVYDAAGNKLKRITAADTRTYIDGIEYYRNSTTNNRDTIDLLHTAEGVARRSGTAYNYEYFLKDYLGNTRIVANKAGTVLQQTDYYPFGMSFSKQPYLPKKYLYNGKEQQQELDGTEGGLYDYGARFYDPVIGRWHVVDPLSEKSRRFSVYNYALNNPIRFIDPDGMEGESIHIDPKGNILKNIDDGDNRVFVHATSITTKDVDKAYASADHSAGGLLVGELGKTIDVEGIYTNLLATNIKEAKSIYNPWTFKAKVTDGGDWDLKVQKGTIWGLANDGKTKFLFQGKEMESQDIGNHHFGAVSLAALGYVLSEKDILMQAGDNQIGNKRSKPEWQPTKKVTRTEIIEHGMKQTVTDIIRLPPYGDDPRDQHWIKAGFNYYKIHK